MVEIITSIIGYLKKETSTKVIHIAFSVVAFAYSVSSIVNDGTAVFQKEMTPFIAIAYVLLWILVTTLKKSMEQELKRRNSLNIAMDLYNAATKVKEYRDLDNGIIFKCSKRKDGTWVARITENGKRNAEKELE